MNSNLLFINNIIIIVFLFITGYIMPDITRKEIFFGVKVAEVYKDRNELWLLRKKYKRNYLISSGGISFIFLVLTYIDSNENILLIGVFSLIFSEFINFYIIHSVIKKLKKSERWNEGKNEVVVVDTKFRDNDNKRLLVSPAWFLISIMLVFINIIISLILYDKLPEAIPIRWTLDGHVMAIALKSYKLILMQPIRQLIIIIIMFLVYKTIGWAKQQIDPQNIETSREQNRLNRRRWSSLIVIICTIMSMIIVLVNFIVLGVIDINTKYISFMVIFPVVFIVGSILYMTIWTGQGGSRIRIAEVKKREEKHMDRDDDIYWKLGRFYYNPGDPAVFLEKRFGIGWTINFARPLAVILMAAILGGVLLIPLIIGML